MKKKFLSLVLIATLATTVFTGCSFSVSFGTNAKYEKEAKEVVDEALGTVKSGDVEGFKKYVDPSKRDSDDVKVFTLDKMDELIYGQVNKLERKLADRLSLPDKYDAEKNLGYEAKNEIKKFKKDAGDRLVKNYEIKSAEYEDDKVTVIAQFDTGLETEEFRNLFDSEKIVNEVNEVGRTIEGDHGMELSEAYSKNGLRGYVNEFLTLTYVDVMKIYDKHLDDLEVIKLNAKFILEKDSNDEWKITEFGFEKAK